MNILLVADLGKNKDGFYHVGDEAMFYVTYLWYLKNHPRWHISIFSRYKSHQNLKLTEFLTNQWTSNNNFSRAFYIKLYIKLILYKFLGINSFPIKQKKIVDFIQKQDKIHFIGGGNLSSIFLPQCHFYFFIITVGWLLNKEIILTSQTIGPFLGIDLLFVPLILNLPKKIALREKLSSNNSLKKYCIYFPEVKSMIDAAYTLSVKTNLKIHQKKPEILRIGLSIHPWGTYENQLKKATINLLNLLLIDYKLEIVIIPHVLLRKSNEDDIGYMNSILRNYSNRISIIQYEYKSLMTSSDEPSMCIKYLTSQVDLLITSRYHGIIFALSSNIPCITFNMDEYYNQKNKGALTNQT